MKPNASKLKLDKPKLGNPKLATRIAFLCGRRAFLYDGGLRRQRELATATAHMC